METFIKGTEQVSRNSLASGAAQYTSYCILEIGTEKYLSAAPP